MKQPLKLFLPFILAISIISCNSDSKKDISTTKEDIQLTDTMAKPDTIPGATLDQDLVEDGSPKSVSDFHKVLNYKNISFTVSGSGQGSLQQVTIQPAGLSAGNQPISLQTEPVTGAEVEDLNHDGFPELLIFTQSAGSGSYGKVLAYSVNNGKSLSQISFIPANENSQIKDGYMGHDDFQLENKKLVHRFPLFEKGEVNSARQGKSRVVRYKLVDGEASRIFQIDKVTEIAEK